MTRDEFVDRKMAIEAKMKATRVDERRDISKINEEYELRLFEHMEKYLQQKRAIFDERENAREEVSEHYKNLRRELFVQDQELVHQWRSQLMAPAEENLNNGQEKGGAL